MRKLTTILLMATILLIAVGCGGSASSPETSLEGYQQITRGMTLRNVQTLLGETSTELPAERWGAVTNQTERVLEFQDHEHQEITYRIELDSRNRVIAYLIRFASNTLPILEESTAQLNFGEIHEEFFPSFVLNENRASQRVYRRDIAHHISRTDWNRRIGNGIENRRVNSHIQYFQNGRTYTFFFDDSDRLSEISISRGVMEEQTAVGTFNETLELVNWDITIGEVTITDTIDWVSDNFVFVSDPGMEFVVVSLIVTSREGNTIQRFEPGLATIRAGSNLLYNYVPIGMVRWDLVGNFAASETKEGFIAFQVSEESLNNEGISLMLEFVEDHMKIEFDLRQ